MLYELVLGQDRLVVDPDGISNKQVINLRTKLQKARKKYLWQTKYPQKDNETAKEWEKRVEEERAEDLKIRPDETVEQYLERSTDPNLDLQSLLKDFVEVIAYSFDQGHKFNSEVWDSVSYAKAKAFVRLVLIECDEPMAELFE